jgi:hypothetical protein
MSMYWAVDDFTGAATANTSITPQVASSQSFLIAPLYVP